ncbi:MAG: alanine--tRNA ligase-related protein [Alphaproteobacteria bacterium]|nr:alanine--tRNA ligase-related protein [Alphaproteobacteria bacterium]
MSRVVGRGEDPNRGSFLVFDETVFYPQGGGQPSDTGLITIHNKTYTVNFVSFFDGLVKHYIQENISAIEKGSLVLSKIDPERRILNAKAHTAGHLLGSIVESLAPELIAFKGFHFQEGPYVEFEGQLKSMSSADLIERANLLINQAIASNVNVICSVISSQEPSKFCIESPLQIPSGKTERVVTMDGFEPVPCGGTHLKNISELGSVNIRKIQGRNGNTKVSYKVQ